MAKGGSGVETLKTPDTNVLSSHKHIYKCWVPIKFYKNSSHASTESSNTQPILATLSMPYEKHVIACKITNFLQDWARESKLKPHL
jgi:hypothetical protein